MTTTFVLREGSKNDLPDLSVLDSSFSSEWILYLERTGSPDEQGIQFSWRQLKPAGSRRALKMDMEELKRELGRSERLVIAEADAQIVGYVMLAVNWNQTAEMAVIVVDANYRRQGLGRQFVQVGEDFTRERGLRAIQWGAQSDNRSAIEFALSRGFHIAGFHDALYFNRGYEYQDADDFRGVAVFLTREFR